MYEKHILSMDENGRNEFSYLKVELLLTEQLQSCEKNWGI